MSEGQLIAVVGPSGVGKDSLIDGILAARPDIERVQRVITRAPGLEGEDYDAVSPDEFKQLASSGKFCLHWSAHNLEYGLPAETLRNVLSGKVLIANFSRKALLQASEIFPNFLVLNVTATPETLAKRLVERGRETSAEIAKRLQRSVDPIPASLRVIAVSNDGALEDAIANALAALQPKSA